MMQTNRPTVSLRFADTLTRDVTELRANRERLFITGEARIAPSADRDVREFRDTVQALLPPCGDRTIFKLGFVWHEQHADIFCDTVQESLSRLGMCGRYLANDIQGRARSFVRAIGASCVSVDLLCSRFSEGMSPVHVDYPEFLKVKEDASGSPLTDHRAFAFVMPYVGGGTEYLQHPRALVENLLRHEIIAKGTSPNGISDLLSGSGELNTYEWSSVPPRAYSIHRNGLAIHRSPSSEDLRVVLAIDACVSNETRVRPLQGIREKIIHNQRALSALKTGGVYSSRCSERVRT
jgi:hypothetical protein